MNREKQHDLIAVAFLIAVLYAALAYDACTIGGL